MPPRRRQRHHAKPVAMKKLDQHVVMAAYAQESTDWRMWRARHVSLRKALEMVAASEAQAITRKSANGIITFYRETKPSRAGSPTPCTLTLSTMLAVGRSKDGSKAKLEPREYNEVVKFRVWPLIGDTRAVAVRPRITPREKAFAEKLFEKAKTKAVTPKKDCSTRGEVQALYFDAPAEMVTA
jgi:hypothetical protein